MTEYQRGRRNGWLDAYLGLRSTIAWLDEDDYGRGYREGWHDYYDGGSLDV